MPEYWDSHHRPTDKPDAGGGSKESPKPEHQALVHLKEALKALQGSQTELSEARDKVDAFKDVRENIATAGERLAELEAQYQKRKAELLGEIAENQSREPEVTRQVQNQQKMVQATIRKFLEQIIVFANHPSVKAVAPDAWQKLARFIREVQQPDLLTVEQSLEHIGSICSGIRRELEIRLQPPEPKAAPVVPQMQPAKERQPSPTRVSEGKEALKVHIRWMIRRDMPEVLDTESRSFEQAWTEEDFLRCLRQRNCIGMVAEHGEKVVGFLIYELHKFKLHILNFAVHPAWRGMDIGTAMAAKLVSKLSSHRRTKISVDVRESNLPAQLFFHEQEFQAKRVQRQFYEDTGEDAYLMEYRWPDSPDEEEDAPPVNRIAQYEEE